MFSNGNFCTSHPLRWHCEFNEQKIAISVGPSISRRGRDVNGISIRIHQSDAYTVNVALNVAVVHDLSKKSRGNVIIVI